MTHASRQTGLRGEQIAQSFLRQKGFRIEASNWRTGQSGELDIIAFHPRQALLCFIEVKTRKSNQYGNPHEAVDHRKIHRILHLAEAYLAQHPPSNDTLIRFDVITVSFPGQNQPAAITHMENAFNADQ